jgi:transcriptional regulator with XRE-family HTH domain
VSILFNSMSVEVGKQLKAVRTAFGLSQRELAKRAGVTSGMVSLIEQSRVSPSVGSCRNTGGLR